MTNAAVANASAHVRWGPTTVIDARASTIGRCGRPTGAARGGGARGRNRLAIDLHNCPNRRKDPRCSGSAMATRHDDRLLRSPESGCRRRQTDTTVASRRDQDTVRPTRPPSPSRSLPDQPTCRQDVRARNAPPLTCSSQVQASTTSITSAPASSRWSSPRLIRLISLDSRNVENKIFQPIEFEPTATSIAASIDRLVLPCRARARWQPSPSLRVCERTTERAVRHQPTHTVEDRLAAIAGSRRA